MSDEQLPAITRQKLAVPGRSRRNAVTGKLKAALEAMVWEGLKRDDAAAKAGLASASLRFALRKPHVLAFYRNECDALRESVRTDEKRAKPGGQQTPGLQIIIVQHAPALPPDLPREVFPVRRDLGIITQ